MDELSRSTRHSLLNFGFPARLSLFFGAIFLVIGFHLPYFPVWLEWRGLAPAQIGIVLCTPMIVRIIATPAISFLADRMADRRRVLVALAWAAFAGMTLYPFTSGFQTILAVSVITAIAWTSIMPVTEAIAMEGVKRDGHDYGRMRLWGSLTFIAASFAGGVALQAWGNMSAIWLLIAAAAFTVLAAHLLPRPSGKGRLKAATTQPIIRIENALALIRSPLFLLFVVVTGLIQASHAVYYSFGTIHWQAQGISTSVIGLLWSVGVIAEILLFVFSRAVIEMVGVSRLIWMAALAGIARWTIMAFSPGLLVLFPVQVLHGLTFGAAHLAAVHFISDAVPQETTGTAQGIYAAVSAGIAMGLAILMSGPLYESFAGHAYFAMTVMTAFALAGALVLANRWRSGDLVVPAQ